MDEGTSVFPGESFFSCDMLDQENIWRNIVVAFIAGGTSAVLRVRTHGSVPDKIPAPAQKFWFLIFLFLQPGICDLFTGVDESFLRRSIHQLRQIILEVTSELLQQ